MTERGMNLKELRDEMKREIRNDIDICGGEIGVSPKTVARWINILDQIMQMPAFDPNQTEMFPPPPRARTTDRQTSHDAAQEVAKHDLNEMRGNILYLLGAFGALTDPELGQKYWDNFEKQYAESTIRTRRNECVMMGWVRPARSNEKTTFTRWEITGIGWEALTHWRADEDQSGE